MVRESRKMDQVRLTGLWRSTSTRKHISHSQQNIYWERQPGGTEDKGRFIWTVGRAREPLCHFKLSGIQHGCFSSVQSLSHVWLFTTPETAACQASPSITSSWSLLKLMSIELMMPSNHLILCRPFSSCLQSFPATGSFPMSQLFSSGGQRTGVAASASGLSMNTQDWSPLGWTGWISLQSNRLSSIFSNTTVQKHQFFGI